MKHFIYLTTNLITGEKYIGKHYGELDDNYLGSGIVLQRAIKKYGEENFKRNILYISKDAKENNEKEKEFIKLYNAVNDRTFYNIASGGDGGDIFHKLPLEQQEQLRAKISKQNSGSGNPMFKKHHTEETKEKLRRIDKSYTKTEEYKKHMGEIKSGSGNGMFGKHHSEQSKQKMSDAKKGRCTGKLNGNAKGISAYKDKKFTQLVKDFDTIQDALIWVGTKSTDYSGISKRIKENKPYKGYYWRKKCRD